MTSLVYGAVTSSHVSPRQFWPLQLYAAEARFVRLNVTVSVPTRGRGRAVGHGGLGVLGVYGRRGAFPSHTRYDVFHVVDVDQLSALTTSSRPRRHASNVSELISSPHVNLSWLPRPSAPNVCSSSRSYISDTTRPNLTTFVHVAPACCLVQLVYSYQRRDDSV